MHVSTKTISLVECLLGSPSHLKLIDIPKLLYLPYGSYILNPRETWINSLATTHRRG